jgi:hypothetical protein
MSRNEYVTPKMVDEALDFAELNKRSIDFCRRMLLVFRVKGQLTDNQVLALLRIKAGILRSRSRHY